MERGCLVKPGSAKGGRGGGGRGCGGRQRVLLVLLYKGQISRSLGQDETLCECRMPGLWIWRSKRASGDKWASAMARFSCPCCSSRLVSGCARLHVEPPSLAGMSAQGSLNWAIWRSLSQLGENAQGDILPLKQPRWPGLEK